MAIEESTEKCLMMGAGLAETKEKRTMASMGRAKIKLILLCIVTNTS